MKYSICIELLFYEELFNKRLIKTAQSCFGYFEFWSWTGKDLELIKKLSIENNIKPASFSGDDMFSMISSKESEEYYNYFLRSIEIAKYLDCENLIIHSDAIINWNAKELNENLSYEEKLFNSVKMMKRMAIIAEKEKINLQYEMLNDTVDHKNYFANDIKTACKMIKEVSSERVKILFDVYHVQIMHGNIINNIKNNSDLIGYIHIGDVPGRNEPGTGELNYCKILEAINSLGYKGFIGFELSPKDNSVKAINAIKKILI